jgi:hypothetical protein
MRRERRRRRRQWGLQRISPERDEREEFKEEESTKVKK